MRRIVPLSLICTLLMAGVARSTTVIPPTFESLVSSANTIFVGDGRAGVGQRRGALGEEPLTPGAGLEHEVDGGLAEIELGLIADVVAVIGSTDVVMGDVDR